MKVQVIETSRFDKLMGVAEYFYNGYCQHTHTAKSIEAIGLKHEAADEWAWAEQHMRAWLKATEAALAERRGEEFAH